MTQIAEVIPLRPNEAILVVARNLGELVVEDTQSRLLESALIIGGHCLEFMRSTMERVGYIDGARKRSIV